MWSLYDKDKFLEPLKFSNGKNQDDVVKDYDAVKTSIQYLQTTKPFGPHSKWPAIDLTFEQDLADLREHQQEFQKPQTP